MACGATMLEEFLSGSLHRLAIVKLEGRETFRKSSCRGDDDAGSRQKQHWKKSHRRTVIPKVVRVNFRTPGVAVLPLFCNDTTWNKIETGPAKAAMRPGVRATLAGAQAEAQRRRPAA